MEEQQILETLIELLEDQGVSIRYEPLEGLGGGLCEIAGHQTFFVDTHASISDQTHVAAQVTSQLIDLESIYLRPQIRDYIQEHQNTDSSERLALEGNNGYDASPKH